jgi:hypothetical protein
LGAKPEIRLTVRTLWFEGESVMDLCGRSPKVHARIAGLMGLAVLASGSFSGLVASRLIVRDDVAATLSNITTSEALFRLGISGGFVMMIAWLLYALLLYRLLEPVQRLTGQIMLALVIASVPVYMLNQASQYAVLLSAPDKLLDQAKLFLELFRFGNLVGAIFFGLWLLPLGFLVLRSSFLPRLLGILLMIGSLGYLVLFVQAFHFPGSEGGLWSSPLLVVTHLSELALMLWLLIRGVNVEQWERAARNGNAQPALPADAAKPRG